MRKAASKSWSAPGRSSAIRPARKSWEAQARPVVVLDETLDARRAGKIALATAVLVMTAAIVKLARVEAVTTRDRVDAEPHDRVGQPALMHRGDAVHVA